jgi:uncharacterized protein YecE (DUF72 family)
MGVKVDAEDGPVPAEGRPLAREDGPAPSTAPWPDLRIGTSGWHYASWNGPFYPPEAKGRLLAFYAERFGATEINNSFYRLPSEDAVRNWRETTPEDFVFAWKAPRIVTHYKRLRNTEADIPYIFGRMDGLGEKFGPVLFQLPPRFLADRERLGAFLSSLPRERRYTFEFRHPSWFEPAILDVLRDHDVALCIGDHAAAPSPWEVTSDLVYIRGHGPSGRYFGHYDDDTLRLWAERIAGWRAHGRTVHCYFDNDIKSAAPADARRLVELTRP